MRISLIGAGAVALGVLLGAARAETVEYTATLNGATEVPANTSAGSGAVTADLDTATHVLTYKVTFSGLTGTATAAHIHGPAAAGANAPPVVMLGGSMAGMTMALSSPIAGKATLTDAQIADLNAGKYYVNVHTAANPSGEIRGWLQAQK